MNILKVISLGIVLGVLLSLAVFCCRGQTYYHDPSLNLIVNNSAYIDADINRMSVGLSNAIAGIDNTNSAGLTIYQLDTNVSWSAAGVYGVISNGFGTNSIANALTMANIGQNLNQATTLSNGIASAVFGSNVASYLVNPMGGATNYDASSVSAGSGNLIYLGSGAEGFLGPQASWATVDLNPFGSTGLLNLHGFESTFAIIRNVIIVAADTVYFFWMLGCCWEWIARVANHKQTEGSKESVLGTNLAGPIACAFATIIAITLIAMATYFGQYIFFSHGNNFVTGAVSGYGAAGGVTMSANGIATYLAAQPGWQMVTLEFPFWELCYLAVSFLIFRYVLGEPICIGASFIVLMLVV